MKQVSEFIPYRFINGKPYLFVQKRTKDAPFAPDMFGIFGGQIEEGESPEVGLMREVAEELAYRPVDVKFFRSYELAGNFQQYVFLCEVDDRFEAEITVLEGEYGKFFDEPGLEAEKVIDVDRIIFNDVFRWLSQNKKAEVCS